MKIRLSIITVCFNAENTIAKTIDSVLKHVNDNFEYIIIDGKSKDNTVSIINNYINTFQNKNIPFKFISENDTGIYDAMNKGIKYCSGDWMMFLNCGDYLIDNVDISIFQKDTIYCYGFYYYFISNNDRYRKKEYPHISKYDLPTCHNSIIFPKSTIYYDLKYRYCADYDFYNKYIENGTEVCLMNNLLIEYLRDGVSEVYLIPTFKEKYLLNIKKHKNVKTVVYLFIFYVKAILLRYLKKIFPKNILLKRRLKIGYTKF